MILSLKKFAFGALCLALLFFSCTQYERDNSNDPDSEGYYGGLPDSRDGQAYRTVTIGEQVWMAENLNYAASGSKCYDDQDSNCVKYGRLYDWAAAKLACPTGWHLPTRSEWNELRNFVTSDSKNDSYHLKATSGWNCIQSNKEYNRNGVDTYGFTAIPSFVEYFYYGSNSVYSAMGYWWSTSGDVLYYGFREGSPAGGVVYSNVYCQEESVGWIDKDYYDDDDDDDSPLYSVRCLQNPKCNGVEYDPSTHGCENEVLLSKCGGGSFYNPATQFCFGLDPLNKCGGLEYNPNTHACESGVLQPVCGDINTETQFCIGTIVYDKCGGLEYNPSSQICENRVVKNLCGGLTYSNSTQFCSAQDGKVYNRCGGSDYNTVTHFCNSNAVQSKSLCGDVYYNPATQFCSEQDGTVYNRCGGSDYNTVTHFCNSNAVQTKPLCGDVYYNPAIYFCSEQGTIKFSDDRDGKTYGITTIGTQVWMAENLNYDASGVCYDNEDSYCDIYGRLYDWVTAMALPSSCQTTFCASQINAKHRGICPEGWHIPSADEWTVLMNSVGGISTAGKHLKATSGWDNNGLDTYGFAALPGGSGYSGGDFGNAGDDGYWWSSSEDDSNNAYLKLMNYREVALWGYSGKSYLFSVRCLQD